MKMNIILLPITLISLTLTLFTIPTTTATTTNTTTELASDCQTPNSIPDLLTQFNLPPGLFPSNVNNFDVTYNSAQKKQVKLTVTLNQVAKPCYVFFTCVQPCYVATPDFNALYANTITATLSENKLSNLEGVRFKPQGSKSELDDVTEVQAYFNVKYQFKSKQGFSNVFPFENLEEPPTCRYDVPQVIIGTKIDVV